MWPTVASRLVKAASRHTAVALRRVAAIPRHSPLQMCCRMSAVTLNTPHVRGLTTSDEFPEEVKDMQDELAPMWKVSREKLHELWAMYDTDNNGVISLDQATGLIERVLETQRKELSAIIIAQRDTKDDLLNDMSSWLPAWKQWGVTLELETQDSKIGVAEQLLVSLHDPAVAEAIRSALTPNANGEITHFNFMSVLRNDESVRDVELQALAHEADAANEVAETEAEVKKAAAEKAAAEAAAAAEVAQAAALAAAEAAKAAKAAKGDTAAEEAPAASTDREVSSDPGDEELDFMDLLASLDLLDYSNTLYDQQITEVEDLKLLTKDDLAVMGFSVGAGNRLYKWVRRHRDKEDSE